MCKLKIVEKQNRGLKTYVVKRKFFFFFWESLAEFHLRRQAEDFMDFVKMNIEGRK